MDILIPIGFVLIMLNGILNDGLTFFEVLKYSPYLISALVALFSEDSTVRSIATVLTVVIAYLVSGSLLMVLITITFLLIRSVIRFVAD